jgi:hypothetical protein
MTVSFMPWSGLRLAKRIAPRPKTLNEAQSSIRFTERGGCKVEEAKTKPDSRLVQILFFHQGPLLWALPPC